MADLAQLERALVKAHSAGDSDSARALAGEIRKMRGPLQQVSAPSEPVAIGKEAFPDALRETLRGTDWGTRNIAGAGTALSNLIEGISQFAGKEDKQRIAANSIIRNEAPIGTIAGEAAMMAAPFSAVSKPATAAAVGAGYGLAQPVEGAETSGDVAKGKTIGAVIGGAAGGLGQLASNKFGAMVQQKMTALAERKARNSLLDQTLKESIDAGYSVPPSMMPDSSATARIAEGMSGKYKTNQAAGIKNQDVTNELARKAVGIADNEPISVSALDRVRDSAYSPYREISSLPMKQAKKATSEVMDWGTPQPAQKGFNPKQALEDLKQARSDAKGWFESYNRSANPEELAKAKAFRDTAESLETSIEDYATSVGRSDLVPALRNARKVIAQTYDIERALQKGSGNVDAKVLGRLFEKQKPLSDGLDTIGKFGATFKDVAGVPKSGNANPFTALDFMQMSGTAPLGMIAAGHPLGAAAAGMLPISRLLARKAVLSPAAQKAMSAPLYELPQSTRIGDALLRYAPIGGTVAGVNAVR